MDQKETARIIAMVASIDHRVPPLSTHGPDERVPVWQMVLSDLDCPTCQQGVLELARDPGMIALRPGDIYQATKRVMRRHLAATDVSAIEPPDDMTAMQTLAWRRSLIRAVGRGLTADAARVEADQFVGVGHGPEIEGPKRRGLPRTSRDMRALTVGRTPPRPAPIPASDEIRAELEAVRDASRARGHA